MDLKIDPSGHVPIYLQIVKGIRSAVDSGVLLPGEALPSLRALGVELLVNPNTVQKAYDELEREGLIYPRRGVGMFVTERGSRPAEAGGEDGVIAALRGVIEAARAAEVPAERLRRLFEQALNSDRQMTGGRR